jgi:hypothetical protein
MLTNHQRQPADEYEEELETALPVSKLTSGKRSLEAASKKGALAADGLQEGQQKKPKRRRAHVEVSCHSFLPSGFSIVSFFEILRSCSFLSRILSFLVPSLRVCLVIFQRSCRSCVVI